MIAIHLYCPGDIQKPLQLVYQNKMNNLDTPYYALHSQSFVVRDDFLYYYRVDNT